MREIKFRIWDINNKKYIHFNHRIMPDVLHNELLIDLGGYLTKNNRRINPDNYIIEQFTGLKDSNGEDIYESDIIKQTLEKGPNLPERYKNYILKDFENVSIHPVKWSKYDDGAYVSSIECWMFGSYSISDLINMTKSNYQEWIRKYEIIGNVHENPELLTS